MPFPVFAPAPIGLLVEFVSNVGGALLIMTGAWGGFLGALAVLTDRTARRTERWAAAGFIVGFLSTVFFVVIDAIIGSR
ncbi:MAG TPA: hypothetical protein VH703_06300 [Solirubrobacterales bacterium]|jgi:hypothetical protein